MDKTGKRFVNTTVSSSHYILVMLGVVEFRVKVCLTLSLGTLKKLTG